jgi:ribosomal protein S18 acetylase RimI-like enzyme
MLRIRRFIIGRDESTWVGVLNAAYGEFRDWRTISVEEFVREEHKDSRSLCGERWVAELDGYPVGVVHVFDERMEDGKRGVVDDLAIIPKLRGSSVEKELAEFVVDRLERWEVKKIFVPRLRWSDLNGRNRVQFLEDLGFNMVRKTSLMEIDLTRIPSDIDVNKGFSIRPLSEHVHEDIEKLNSLRNECAQGQVNFRPTSVEEIRHLLRDNLYSYLKSFFAVQDGKCVGFVIIAIDERYNSEKNTNAGIVLGLGVLRNHRRSGIGTALMLYGLRVLRTEKMTRAILDVDDFNETGALKLYERIGFNVLEKYLTYEKSVR